MNAITWDPSLRRALRDSLAGLAYAAALVALWLWQHWIVALIVAAVLGVVMLAAFIQTVTLGPEGRRQADKCHLLHLTARQLPTGLGVADPESGRQFWVERHRGFLALAVCDPVADPVELPTATVTGYLIGFLGTDVQAPVIRHTVPLGENPNPAAYGVDGLGALLGFNRRTGVMDASTEELAELWDQLSRAIQVAHRRRRGER